MKQLSPQQRELVSSLARRLGAITGIKAVVLGGSHARGRAQPRSDIDLYIFYSEPAPFSIQSIRELAEAFQQYSPVPGGSVRTKPRTDTALWSRSPGGTFLDCSRLRRTGWIPQVSIDAGVARTVRHHVEAGTAG